MYKYYLPNTGWYHHGRDFPRIFSRFGVVSKICCQKTELHIYSIWSNDITVFQSWNKTTLDNVLAFADRTHTTKSNGLCMHIYTGTEQEKHTDSENWYKYVTLHLHTSWFTHASKAVWVCVFYATCWSSTTISLSQPQIMLMCYYIWLSAYGLRIYKHLKISLNKYINRQHLHILRVNVYDWFPSPLQYTILKTYVKYIAHICHQYSQPSQYLRTTVQQCTSCAHILLPQTTGESCLMCPSGLVDHWIDHWIMLDHWGLRFCKESCVSMTMDLGFTANLEPKLGVDHVRPHWSWEPCVWCAQVGWFDYWIMLDLWGLWFCRESCVLWWKMTNLDGLGFTGNPKYHIAGQELNLADWPQPVWTQMLADF